MSMTLPVDTKIIELAGKGNKSVYSPLGGPLSGIGYLSAIAPNDSYCALLNERTMEAVSNNVISIFLVT